MQPKHLVAMLVLLALTLPPSLAHAGGVVGACDEVHLLEALAGGGTVTFGCSGTITLTAAIRIAVDTTIDGSGQTVVITGNHAVRVFQVNSGVTLNLNGLTIADGKGDADGGGILNIGTVTVNNSVFVGNSVDTSIYGSSGGAILNYGTLTVSNSAFSYNTAAGTYGSGGGIANSYGTVNVSNSTFTDNSGHLGGGIANSHGGAVTVSNSTFAGNKSGGGGGGINNTGMLTVSDSFFSGNSGRGGGILNDSGGVVIVSNSTFAGNSSGDVGGIGSSGGGILNDGTLTVSNSTFSHNTGVGTYGSGGGIGTSYGTVTVSNSTFTGNAASSGGGISSFDGTVTVSNSTFADNSGGGAGGGIANSYGTVTVSNSTFSGNSAVAGGGMHNSDGTLTLKNTIVANSPRGENCAGAITDGGGNLSYPDATCPGINGDPVLGPLQDNGGPTQTDALLVGSAAIDAGDPAGCTDHQGNLLSTDQRSLPRFGRCDIGAYELQPLGFSTKVADHTIVSSGDSVGYTITLTNGGTSPIPGVRVTDTLPASFVYVPGSLTATDGTPDYLSGVITWGGQIDAGQEVRVLFAARAGSEPGKIANLAVISGGGETFTRTATVQVRLPTYLPLVRRYARLLTYLPLVRRDVRLPAYLPLVLR